MLGKKSGSADVTVMSNADIAIWHTVDINQRIDSGELAGRAAAPTSFPPQFDTSETMLASGPFSLLEFTSAGDGSYVHQNSAFFGGGGAALAFGAAFTVGTAIGNSNRRRAAAQAAAHAWRPVDSGDVTVSTHGFYLRTPRGLLPWGWGAIQEAQLVGPQQVNLSGDSDRGRVGWIICSDWAELLFTMWARVMHPQHPQFVTRTWIPEGWAGRVQSCNVVLPSRRNSIGDCR